ncbi:MAG: class I SAM-dependent methyltransferase [Pseudomonadota bacterium]
MTDAYSDFSLRPWDSAAWDPSPEAEAVPTMLSDEEGRLLTWLGGHWARGAGAACDLGCFAGGSTARLADGLVRGGIDASVHAFDFFTISPEHKQKFLHDRGVRRFWGTNLLPCAKRLLKPWRGRVTLHREDLAKTRWTAGPIEILFIDAMKTPETADAILRNFVPALVPGRSIIVHQDYQHWRQPWIAAQMVLLRPHLRPVAWCAQNTTVFAVDSLPDAAGLAAAATDGMTDARMTELLHQALWAAPAGPPRRMIAQSILGLEDAPGCRVPFRFDRSGFTPKRIRRLLATLDSGEVE